MERSDVISMWLICYIHVQCSVLLFVPAYYIYIYIMYAQDTSSECDGGGEEDGSEVLGPNLPQPRPTGLVVHIMPVLSSHQLHCIITRE